MSNAKTVYLDHAATSYPKPPAVLSAVTECMKHSGGNPGRSSHRQALAAAKEISKKARISFASGVHCSRRTKQYFV